MSQKKTIRPRWAFAVTLAMFAMAASIVWPLSAEAQTRLDASHQWPGGQGDVRDQMVQIVADRAEEADVGLQVRVYPGASLYQPLEQWPALSRGRLAITALPLAYVGGRVPEVNLTLMPGLVRNHDHAQRINESPFMERLEEIMLGHNVKVLAHTWLAGGFGSTEGCIVHPDDADGIDIRAAGSAFEQMLSEAGASIASMPSSEIYTGVQTGVLNAANTSSASFVSFRLYEQLECVTPPGDYALWFMYQPILMSTQIWDSLNEEQQAVLLEAGAEAQEFAYHAAIEADERFAEVYEENGRQVAYMTEEDFEAWREIAERSAYANFVDEVEGGQELLDMALDVE